MAFRITPCNYYVIESNHFSLSIKMGSYFAYKHRANKSIGTLLLFPFLLFYNLFNYWIISIIINKDMKRVSALRQAAYINSDTIYKVCAL